MVQSVYKTIVGVLLTLCFGLITIKILAFTAGPIGVGFFSIFRQLQQTGSLIGSLGGQTALIQGLASRKSEEKLLYIKTALAGYTFCSSLVAAILWLNASSVAQFIFSDSSVKQIGINFSTQIYSVKWSILAILFGVIMIFFQGILNGYRALGKLALLQVVGAAVGAFVAYPSAILFNANQPIAILFILLGSSLGSTITGGYAIWRAGWLAGIWKVRFKPSLQKAFIKLTLSILVANILSLLTLLLIRSKIVRDFGLQGAGLFDAAWTISNTYVLIILSSLGTYYLPTLSAENNLVERQILIRKILTWCTAASIPLVCALILLRDPILHFLYSDQFIESTKVMRFMLLGDYLKICGWVLAMPLVAKARANAFLIGEIIANIVFLILSLTSSNLENIGVAFLISYAVYLTYIVVLAIYSKYIHVKYLLPWVFGAFFLCIVSYLSWQQTPSWYAIFGLLITAFSIGLWTLKGNK